VNALSIGVLKKSEIKLARADGPGNRVVLFGARTGGDGIGGASVLASATFDEDKPSKRPSVQVGDPFMEKVLIECCLEIYAEDLVTGIQDLGAAGLSCATTELAAAGTGGMDVQLDLAPLRDATLVPEEILMSESQERMMAVVTPENLTRFFAICEKWDVIATVIGTVTDTGRLRMTWHGDTIVDVDPRTLAHQGPVYERPYHRPEWQDALQADVPDSARLERPKSGEQLRETVLRMIASPNLADKTWVLEQFDHRVRGNTVLAHGEDSGMLRLSDESNLGIALSTDGNGRYTKLDPYTGAQLALAEAYRNVAATGAKPLAVTDCLNFGSPEDPEVMWQFAEACRGLADGCLELGTPVTGGNVSFYNQTGAEAIHPTPIVGVLGVIDDVSRRTRAPSRPRARSCCWSARPGTSSAAQRVGARGARPPRRPAAEAGPGARAAAGRDPDRRVPRRDALGRARPVRRRPGPGDRRVLPARRARRAGGAADELDPFVALFSESAGRAVVAVPRSEELRFTDMCKFRGVPVARIGVVDGDALDVQDQFTIPLGELREAWTGTFPALFD
jgi:phosphoribosylformylglycinamidine synthase II